MLPYWEKTVAPSLEAGRRVLIVSHGNTLRALLMYLEGLSILEVEVLEIPTGTPVVYTAEASAGWAASRGVARDGHPARVSDSLLLSRQS